MIFSILFGGITHHYLASDLNYCQKINTHGSIYNPYQIVTVGNKDTQIGIINGTDSACGSIFGPVLRKSITDNLEFVAGGYNANIKSFNERGMEPISYNGITPILGFNYKLYLYKNNNYDITINNVISFGIITHSIGVSF